LVCKGLSIGGYFKIYQEGAYILNMHPPEYYCEVSTTRSFCL